MTKAALAVRDLALEPALTERFLSLPAARTGGGASSAYDRAVLAAALATPDDARAFLALEGDCAVARVLAFADDRLREPDGRPLGRLGLFAANDDPVGARDLVDAALAWLAARPLERRPRRVVAPMDGDTWHRYRLRTSGGDHPPFPGEPDDGPRLHAALVGAGFAPVARFVTKTVSGTSVARVMARWAPAHARAIRHGLTFRALTPAVAAADVGRVHRLAERVFGDNPYFSPIDASTFAARFVGEAGVATAAGGAWRLLVACDSGGEPVGMCFGFEDPNAPGTACLKSFGVVPEWRGSALGPALAHAAYADWAGRGATRFQHALMREGAGATDLDRGFGDMTRTYALLGRDAAGGGLP